MYAGGGKLMDVLGTRRGFTVIMVFWSLACASHGLAASVGMLAASRFLLGIGEGGGFPAATRAVAEWFPVNERSTAMGIINAGTAGRRDVRAAADRAASLSVLRTGAGSSSSRAASALLWTLWWSRDYFPPERHPRLARGGAPGDPVGARYDRRRDDRTLRWLDLLRFRQTWGVVIAKFLSDAAWYFYLFWLPKYLYDARGFDIKAVGTFAWIPYAAAGVGCLVGGWLSSRLLRREASRWTARASSRWARAPP